MCRRFAGYPIVPLLFLAAALLAAAGSPGASATRERIRVTDGAGALLFALDPTFKGFHVENGKGGKIGSVSVEPDRVKVSGADGKPACKVKRKDGGFKLYREPARPGGADVEVAGFRPEGGDFRLRDAADRELYRGRAREGKTRVTGSGGRAWVVKLKEDGVEVEDAAGKRLVRIKGLHSVPAALFCAAPEFNTLQRAAVVAYSARVGK